MCDNEMKWTSDDKLTKKEQLCIMNIAKGLGVECAKYDIDEETTQQMILITMGETARKLVSDRKK
tara:strand:- start:1202 stop:1396 length:195 start_codon:yes stop_codon:yes gene_type:complete